MSKPVNDLKTPLDVARGPQSAIGDDSGFGPDAQDGVRRPRILVADDEAHIRHVVRMKLAHAGYEILTAMDGEEALEMALAEKPDMIITDYQMPYMSGLELCARLRQNEPTRNVPILMLTARGFDVEEHEMAAVGIRNVLSKPFSPREVLRRVRNLLEAVGRDGLTEAGRCRLTHHG